MKHCPKCGETKPRTEFYYDRSKDKLTSYCRLCHNAYKSANRHKYAERTRQTRKAYRSRNPEQAKAMDRKHNLLRHGLTVEAFNAMVAAQEGLCASCGEPPDGQWHVDHDHSCCPGKTSCGKCIRGLLCNGCNHGVGHFKDDPERLRRAAAYLESHQRSSFDGEMNPSRLLHAEASTAVH